MNKRLLAVILTAAMLFSMTGCKNRPAIHLPKAEYVVTAAEEYRKADGNSLKLMYPEISGYADTEAQEYVNRQVAQMAYDVYAKRGLIAGEDGGYSYTAQEMVVLLSAKDFYSVYISGTVESESGGNPEFFAYTVNVDLKNAVLLSTEDIIADYEKIKGEFLAGTFEEDFGTANPEENFTRQSLIEQYKSDYGIYPYVYFREGQFGFILETLMSLGGCAGYQTDIRDVQKYLNTENPVIAMLCGME